MEPKALANLDGQLVPTLTPGKQSTFIDMSPTKEFLKFSSVTSRHDNQALSIAATPTAQQGEEEVLDGSSVLPNTPTPAVFDPTDGNFSPTTPYYMAQGNQLIQQTCPPKQHMQSLFPLSGDIDDQPDESVREKLMVARRKSLQWAPRVASPLGKPMDFGKM